MAASSVPSARLAQCLARKLAPPTADSLSPIVLVERGGRVDCAESFLLHVARKFAGSSRVRGVIVVHLATRPALAEGPRWAVVNVAANPCGLFADRAGASAEAATLDRLASIETAVRAASHSFASEGAEATVVPVVVDNLTALVREHGAGAVCRWLHRAASGERLIVPWVVGVDDASSFESLASTIVRLPSASDWADALVGSRWESSARASVTERSSFGRMTRYDQPLVVRDLVGDVVLGAVVLAARKGGKRSARERGVARAGTGGEGEAAVESDEEGEEGEEGEAEIGDDSEDVRTAAGRTTGGAGVVHAHAHPPGASADPALIVVEDGDGLNDGGSGDEDDDDDEDEDD